MIWKIRAAGSIHKLKLKLCITEREIHDLVDFAFVKLEFNLSR
jgi:hypothetical protein